MRAETSIIKRTRELVFCENLKDHDFSSRESVIEMDLTVKLFHFEKEAGWRANLRYENSSFGSDQSESAIEIDTRLFCGARFDINNDKTVNVTWPTARQINFSRGDLGDMKKGSLKGI